MKIFTTLKYFLVFFLLFSLTIENTAGQSSTLKKHFQDLTSEEAKPWTFWYWMYGAVSKEGITADLEAMKEIGLGGTYLMPIRNPEQDKSPSYSPTYDQLTPEWWELVRFSMEEADRLGLKLGMHICDGFALAGGPWITPENSMQKVVWSDTIVSGGKIRKLRLPLPEIKENYYKEIKLYAIPIKEAFNSEIQKPKVTTNAETASPSFLADKSVSETFRSTSPCWIQYEFEKPFLCRSLEIESNNNYQAQRLTIFASDDGENFKKIKQLTPPRQGWQNVDEDFTFSIPETRARFFRFYWDPAGSEPGAEDLDGAKWSPTLRIRNITLSSEPKIENFEGKNGSIWRLSKRLSAEDIPIQNTVKIKEVIEINPAHLRDGVLNTALPRGKWKIIRLGHTSTGHTNATGGGGRGLEVNKFSRDAINIQLENWFGQAFVKTDPVLAKRVLKFMHVDSWECGSQNWSENFLSEFQKRRGYDLTPYLLVYTGIPIESAEKTESILFDIRQTIAELVVDVFYETLADFAKKHDCEFSAECVSPTMMSDGMMHYKKVDRPMGEFWLQSPTHDKFNDMLDAISGAHIYEKNLIQAEGFTQLRTMWNENPRMIKPLLDRNFALGINKIFHHVYVHNPHTDKAPGMTLDGIGLYFQRDQTWWSHGKTWTEYIQRCQTLLQAGKPVVDIAVFSGEDTPRRALLPERLVNSLPGIFGSERVISEQKRLANEGQTLRVMPVGVTHSANITDAGEWINAMNGYAYDTFNLDALLHLADTENGKLVLPGGMSYSILILPKPHPLSPENKYMSAEVAQKIRKIQQAGVTVLLGDKPFQVPGHTSNRNADNELLNMTNEIWSVSDKYKLPYHNADFSEFNLERDVDFYGEKEIAWNHRRDGNTDIYFISNQKEKLREVDISFRINGKKPELWNPVNGEISEIENWEMENNRTKIKLKLHENQSVFIVFNKIANHGKAANSVKTEKIPLEILHWDVTFLDNPTINRTVSGLFDWSKSSDNRIKYYSGTAVYEADFTMENRMNGDNKIQLDLGKAEVMAKVFVNDMYCGTAWTYPFSVDITKALKTGNNKLKISVVNTWANKMKGVHDGHIKDESIWTNAPYRLDNQPLQHSGLLGPLHILISEN